MAAAVSRRSAVHVLAPGPFSKCAYGSAEASATTNIAASILTRCTIRQQMKTRALTPAELREKARAAWLELRNNPDKLTGKGKSRGLEASEDEDQGETRNKDHSRDGPDDDFSL